MTYNVFGGTLNLTQSINQTPQSKNRKQCLWAQHHAVRGIMFLR